MTKANRLTKFPGGSTVGHSEAEGPTPLPSFYYKHKYLDYQYVS